MFIIIIDHHQKGFERERERDSLFYNMMCAWVLCVIESGIVIMVDSQGTMVNAINVKLLRYLKGQRTFWEKAGSMLQGTTF